jgi:Ras-related protein Rab-8A
MNVESDFETLIKLVIIGDSGVGKSNFLFKFIENKFSPLHVATVGFDYKSKVCILPQTKKKVKLQIWDTAGQEKYMSINKNLFQRVQGIILMYDLTKRETFERLTIWLNIIKQMTCGIPIVLVGNKLDEENNEETGRIVEYSEGEKFAKDNDFQFLEASGMNGTNVEKAFMTIAEKVIKNLEDDRFPSISSGNTLNYNIATNKKKKCGC